MQVIPYLAMSMMILMGSLTIVRRNMASGGPNARNAHPKNSRSAIFLNSLRFGKSKCNKYEIGTDFPNVLCTTKISSGSLTVQFTPKQSIQLQQSP